MMYGYMCSGFGQIWLPKANPMATLRPERDGCQHATYVGSLSIHGHTPTRQIEHASPHELLHVTILVPRSMAACAVVLAKFGSQNLFQWLL